MEHWTSNGTNKHDLLSGELNISTNIILN